MVIKHIEQTIEEGHPTVIDTMTGRLYQVLQSRKSSSSGQGVSYHSVAATCGMKSRLQEQYPYEKEADEEYIPKFTPTGQPKVDPLRCGAFYHHLQELWRKGKWDFGNNVIDASHSDFDYQIALRGFNNYRQYFGNNRDNLGKVLEAEELLPSTDEQRARIRDFFGHDVTIRYDLRTFIDEKDLMRLGAHRMVTLEGPGEYLSDYKLVSQIGAASVYEYSFGMQALIYPIVYNLCKPEAPVRGIITDVQARVQKTEDRHFALFAGYADRYTRDIVKHAIRLSRRAHEEGIANPFACIGKFSPCAFLKNGICKRHGAYDAKS